MISTALDAYLSALLVLVGGAIISRLLTPEQIGVYQLAAIFAALVSTFRDFGLTEYVIQEKELCREKLRTALGLNLLFSYALGGLLFALSWPLEVWFREPAVGELIRLLCITFLLIPWGAVTNAYLKRVLAFDKLFVISLLSGLVSVAAQIIGALSGMGYYALVVGLLAGTITTVVLTNFFRPDSVPLLPSFRNLAPQLSYGLHAAKIYGFSHLARIFPEQVIGRMLGATSVAMFSRSGCVNELFHAGVGRGALMLAMPLFAQAAREPDHRASVMVAKIASIFMAVGWSAAAFMGIFAQPIVLGIYGAQWGPAVPIATVLCLMLALEAPLMFYKEILIAHGKIEVASVLQWRLLLCRVLGFSVGIPFGLMGGAWGLVFGSALSLYLCIRTLTVHELIEQQSFTREVYRSMITAMVSAVCAFLLASHFLPLQNATDLRQIAVVIASGLICTVVWLIALYATKHALFEELRRLIRVNR